MYTYKHESKPCAAIRRFFRLQRWLEFSAFMIVVIAIVVVIVLLSSSAFILLQTNLQTMKFNAII